MHTVRTTFVVKTGKHYQHLRRGSMKIGCVKEIKNNEFRVGLTPDNVKSYVAAGHHVYIEMGAGVGTCFGVSCSSSAVAFGDR